MNLVDSKITRWWSMDSLCRNARDLFANNEPNSDIIPLQDALNAWPFVVTGYNGIELALKALLAAEQPDISTSDMQDVWREHGHDIYAAYNAQSSSAHAHIAIHYAEHRSLWDYDSTPIPTGTVGEFILHISSGSEDGGQAGLLRWRYAPLEGSDGLPTTSVWTMYEIWDAICCCLSTLNHPDRGCSRVSMMLGHALINRIVMESPPHGLPSDWDHEQLNTWINSKRGRGLGSLIDLLGCVYRDSLGHLELSEPMRGMLGVNASAELRRLKARPSNPDERQLMYRIERSQGRLAAVTDPATGECLFKDIP